MAEAEKEMLAVTARNAPREVAWYMWKPEGLTVRGQMALVL
jgi:hypothetical protein